MSKSIKLKNNTYLDSSGVSYNRVDLETVLTELWDKVNAQEQIINTQEQEINKLTPVVLFDNDNAGASNTYTLNDNISNYKRVTVYYKQTSYYTRTDKSIEIHTPNNKTIILDENFVLLSYNGSTYNGAYGLHRAFKFNNNTITLLNSCNFKYVGLNGTGTWGVGDSIAITKVIGYKY